MSILQINSSARLDGSNTRILSQYLVESLDQQVVSRDLARQPLPPISAVDLIDVHGSAEHSGSSFQQQLALSNSLINELREADTLVLGAPLYNFTIPVTLKQWVDAICRAGVSFKYTEKGPVGLLGVQRVYIITASGGTPVGSEMDFGSRYLEHICRFIGIREIAHIDASGSKGSAEQVIAQGKQQIDELLSGSSSVTLSGAS